MEQTLSLIFFIIPVVWFIITVTSIGRYSSILSRFVLGASLVQFLYSLIGLFFAQSSEKNYELALKWIPLISHGENLFHIKLNVPLLLVWSIVSFIVFLKSFYHIQRKENFSENKINHLVVPLLSLSSILSISAENLLTFYMGISLSTGLLLLVNLNNERSNAEKSMDSTRFNLSTVIPEAIFLLGTIGLKIRYGFLSFEKINELNDWNMPLFLILIGITLRSFQLPLTFSAEKILAKSSIGSIFSIQSYLVPLGIFLFKVSSFETKMNMELYESKILLCIPLITTAYVAIKSLGEKNENHFFHLISIHFLSLILVLFFSAHSKIVLFQVVVYLLMLGLYSIYLRSFKEQAFEQNWMLYAVYSVMTALPLFGSALITNYLYHSLFVSAEQLGVWGFISLGCIAFSSLLFSFGCFIFFIEGLARKKQSVDVPVFVGVFFVFLVAMNLSIAFGAGFIGGYEEPFFRAQFPSWTWAENLLIGGSLFSNDQLSSAEFIWARVVSGSIFIFSLILSFAIFSSSEQKIVRFKDKINIDLEKVEDFFWRKFLLAVFNKVSQGFAFIDRLFLRSLVVSLTKTYGFLSFIFATMEIVVFKRAFENGIFALISTFSGGLRVVQNGNVQFYILFGFILFGLLAGLVLGGVFQ